MTLQSPTPEYNALLLHKVILDQQVSTCGSQPPGKLLSLMAQTLGNTFPMVLGIPNHKFISIASL